MASMYLLYSPPTYVNNTAFDKDSYHFTLFMVILKLYQGQNGSPCLVQSG